MALFKMIISTLILFLSLFSVCFSADDYFVVSGVTTGIDTVTGARPLRKDVTTLMGAERDLFLLALQRMQLAHQEEKLSWFQLAGIHGCPPVPWDGVPAWKGRLPYSYPGYAVHTCGLFLPWHRAYLLLIEKVLSRNAMDIAQKYPDELKAEYVKAAESLRWPYWKWDGPSRDLPWIMIEKFITVHAPEGSTIIKNPLESYVFHPVMNTEQTMGYTIFRNRSSTQMAKETVRCPDRFGNSNYAPIAQSMSNMWRGLRTALYNNYIEKDQSYTAWAFTGILDRSVENIHGNVHSAVGCGSGFMTVLAASAFDPAFFLHHANVDRQWELWSAIHYNEHIVQGMCWNEAFAQGPAVENGTSPLYPFHADAAGAFHTPDSVRYTKTLGYAYQEVPDWQFSTQDELAQHVLQYVTTEYTTGHNKLVKSPARPALKRWWVDSFLEVGPGQTATLYYFFGPPAAKVEQWTTKSTMIFSQAFLPRNETKARSARLSLTPYLDEAVETGKLKSLKDDVVKTFLKQHLRWRVVTSDLVGNVSSDFSSIKVQIVDQAVVRVEKNGLVQYGPVNSHHDLMWGGPS